MQSQRLFSMDRTISKNILNMQQNTQERRTMRRFDMRLPATVRLDGAGEFHTETQNVSARGLFFHLDRSAASLPLPDAPLTLHPDTPRTHAHGGTTTPRH